MNRILHHGKFMFFPVLIYMESLVGKMVYCMTYYQCASCSEPYCDSWSGHHDTDPQVLCTPIQGLGMQQCHEHGPLYCITVCLSFNITYFFFLYLFVFLFALFSMERQDFYGKRCFLEPSVYQGDIGYNIVRSSQRQTCRSLYHNFTV